MGIPVLKDDSFFLLNDTAHSDIYSLSLRDALPISYAGTVIVENRVGASGRTGVEAVKNSDRSEEHTSELQSPYELVCRLLPEKKKAVTLSSMSSRESLSSTGTNSAIAISERFR